MGHILTKKTSPIDHLRTMNTVTVPRFNRDIPFYEKFNSIQSINCVESAHSGSRKDIQRRELYQNDP